MVWAKLHDGFPDSPKVGMLAPELRAYCIELYIAAICYCNRELTDGYVPNGQIGRLADFTPHDFGVEPIKDELLSVGLWESADRGILVHDFLDYNYSREKVEQLRRERSEAGKKGAKSRWDDDDEGTTDGKRHGKPMANAMAKGCPEPEPLPLSLDPSPYPDAALKHSITDEETKRQIEELRGRLTTGEIRRAMAGARSVAKQRGTEVTDELIVWHLKAAGEAKGAGK